MYLTKIYVVGFFVLCFIHKSFGLLDEENTLLKAIMQLNSTFQQKVADLRHSNAILQAQVQQSETALNTTIQKSEMKISALEQEVHRLEQGVAPQIIFHAFLSSRKQVGPGQTIEFDRVLTNVGNAYDPRHGHFTAPMDGYYHFSATMLSMPNEYLYVDIVKNGAAIAWLYSDATDFQSSSQSVNIQLAAGDMVWLIQTHSGLYTLDANFCSFSGNIISKIV